MILHPKIKMIAEEFGESYEWIAGDESLFIKVSNHFIDIVKERLKNCNLELIESQQKNDNTYLWFRSPEENEKVLDFIDESQEDEDDLPF
jgi:hypothetical protein